MSPLDDLDGELDRQITLIYAEFISRYFLMMGPMLIIIM
jgi:hypothetical protein